MMNLRDAILAAVRDEVRKAFEGESKGNSSVVAPVVVVEPRPTPIVPQVSETAVKKIRKGIGSAQYITGLRPDIERILSRPEFKARHSGLTLSEMTLKLKEANFLTLTQGEREVKKVVSAMTGKGRKLCLQHNHKYNLWANIKAVDLELPMTEGIGPSLQ